MNYQEIEPPDHLKPYIRYCWILESRGNETSPQIFRTMADGFPGFIFQPVDKGVLYQGDKKLTDSCLFGQTTQHAELQLTGSFKTLGISFYPNALKSIFGFNAAELTNSCLDLDDLSRRKGYCLSDQLLDAATINDQFEILFSYLSREINSNSVHHNQMMEYIMRKILHSKGNINLKELQKYFQLSERSMERRFKEYTGIRPKLFSRICRFQASLGHLRTNNYDKLTDVAFENYYADQSHFIRSFKEFSGFSPVQYQKRSQEIVENLSALT